MDEDKRKKIVQDFSKKATYMLQRLVEKEFIYNEEFQKKSELQDLMMNSFLNIVASIISSLILLEDSFEYIDTAEKFLTEIIQGLVQERRKQLKEIN